MVEPVSTVLTGLALARSGIAFLKENIESVQDGAQIAEQIGNIFKGQDQFNKARYDEGYAKAIGMKDVATEMIEFKLQQEEMYEMKRLVNHRFGLGFWESIVAERARRIDEQKEHEKEIARAKRQKRQEIIDTAQTVGIAIAIVLAICGLILIYILLKDDTDDELIKPVDGTSFTVDGKPSRESSSQTETGGS